MYSAGTPNSSSALQLLHSEVAALDECFSLLQLHITPKGRCVEDSAGHSNRRLSVVQEELENLQDAQNEVMMIMDDDPVKVTEPPPRSRFASPDFPGISQPCPCCSKAHRQGRHAQCDQFPPDILAKCTLVYEWCGVWGSRVFLCALVVSTCVFEICMILVASYPMMAR